jgi:RNA polymerase sigma-70 factor (ECF subfamily)
MGLLMMTDDHGNSDEKLSASLVTNLECGFEKVVLAYQHRLYGFALRLSGNPQDAEEIAQDAFVRAYHALMTYTPPQTATLQLRPWLFQIALNVFRNRIRQVRPKQISLDADEGGPADYLEADRLDQPEQVAVNVEGERALSLLIASLPEHFRIAIVLRHIEGLSYIEMAALLGQPVGTLKAHVHRGVRHLQQALATLEQDEHKTSEASSRTEASMSEVR